MERQRAGDAYPLSLTAAQLMGIALGEATVEADQLQQLRDPRTQGAAARVAVRPQGQRDALGDGLAGLSEP